MSATEGEADDSVETDVPKTQRVFPHSASVGDITLDDEMGGEYGNLEGADDVAVLGYEVISTTGDFFIERSDLLDWMEMVKLPEWMAPDRTAPHRAFNRARDELLDDGNDVNDSHDIVRITYRLEDEEDTSRVYNLLANVHVPSEYVDEDGGANNQYELGVIRYDKDKRKPDFSQKIEPDESKEIQVRLEQEWDQLRYRFAELFDKHRDGHIGKDINTMFNQYFITQWTDSTQLRPAVYFVPATQEIPDDWAGDSDVQTMRDLIGFDEGEDGLRRGFAGLYGYINDAKSRSAKTEDTQIIRLPVYDNADQREMIQRKVRQELEEATRTAYEKILQRMQDEDTVAEEVAAAVSRRFDDMSATSSNYKAIIQTEMAVEDVMDDVLDDMSAENADLIRDVVNEVDEVDNV